MQPDQERHKMTCPINGKRCVEGLRKDFEPNEDGIMEKCRWWVHMYGKDPQSEKIYDKYECAPVWLTVTTIEQSQMARFTTSSVDKVANEVNEIGGKMRAAFGDMVNAFLAMAESNRELLEFKKKQPDVLEIPTNGKHEGSPF